MAGVLQFYSLGFDLFVPPVPISKPPNQPRFVMLDDINDVFYDVDFGLASLGNQASWVDVSLHEVKDAAIVFPPEQQNMLQRASCAVGLLVSVQGRVGDVIHARCLGSVMVKPLPPNFMSWSGLAAKKGPELPNEMRSGLLRQVWSKTGQGTHGLETPAALLNNMVSNFHRDGTALSFQLDGIFVGAKMIEAPSCWRVDNLGQNQMLKSITRAAYFIDH